MKNYLILIFLFSMFASSAQEGFVLTAIEEKGEAISVLWIPADAHFKNGVNIYRKEEGGAYNKLATVIPNSALKDDVTYSIDQRSGVHSLVNSTNRKEYIESFDAVFLAMEVVDSYNFAINAGLAYNDKTAQKGKTYQYKVEGITDGGVEPIGESELQKFTNYKPLPSPSEFTLTRFKRRTEIVWNNNIKKYYQYDLHYKAEGTTEWKKITANHSAAGLAETKKKFFFTIPTHKDTSYQFKIQAKGYFGNKSVEEIHDLKITDLDAPIPPEVRTFAHSTKQNIRISWDAPVDDDVAGYNLLRNREDVDSTYQQINAELIPVNDTVYLDENLTEIGIYYYRLQVLDHSGNVGTSFTYIGEMYDLFAPAIPANFSAKADTGKLILTWDAVAAPDFLGYRIYRSVADEDNSDNIFVPVNNEMLDTNFYIEKMGKNVRNPFVYVVTTIDTLINESEYSNMAEVQLPDVTPPVAPFLKRSYEENQGLAIEWMSNVDADLAGYNLYKKKSSDTTGFQKVNYATIPRSLTVYIDKEAERGQVYEYYLEAIDANGLVSEKSNDLNAKLNFLELAGDIKITKNKVNTNKNEVQLSWETDELINEPVAGTSVYRSFNGGKLLPITKVIQVKELKDKLSNAGEYTYQIRAFGERGGIIKSASITIKIESN